MLYNKKKMRSFLRIALFLLITRLQPIDSLCFAFLHMELGNPGHAEELLKELEKVWMISYNYWLFKKYRITKSQVLSFLFWDSVFIFITIIKFTGSHQNFTCKLNLLISLFLFVFSRLI